MPRLGTLQAEQRLGHDVPAMRSLYTHGTQAMREDLTAALQARWETSLRTGPPSTRTPPSRPGRYARIRIPSTTRAWQPGQGYNRAYRALTAARFS
jgi:hypothetical protein